MGIHRTPILGPGLEAFCIVGLVLPNMLFGPNGRGHSEGPPYDPPTDRC